MNKITISNKSEINKILKFTKKLNIQLLPFEIKYLDKLLESKKKNQKLFISIPRQQLNKLIRVDLIYALYSNQVEYEKEILYGTSNRKYKGLNDTLYKK